MYSAASAVLVNECLKGLISLAIALYNTLKAQGSSYSAVSGGDEDNDEGNKGMGSAAQSHDVPLSQLLTGQNLSRASATMMGEIFRSVLSAVFVKRAVRKLCHIIQLLADMLFVSHSADCWKLGVPACLYVVQNNVSRGLCGAL